MPMAAACLAISFSARQFRPGLVGCKWWCGARGLSISIYGFVLVRSRSLRTLLVEIPLLLLGMLYLSQVHQVEAHWHNHGVRGVQNGVGGIQIGEKFWNENGGWDHF